MNRVKYLMVTIRLMNSMSLGNYTTPALFNEWASSAKYSVMKSFHHSDGTKCFGGGWFIVIAQLPTGQISNHYKLEDWDLFECDIIRYPPQFDGHTPQDVLTRLKDLIDVKDRE